MHHSDFLVRSTGRFIHLILKTYLIRKGRKAQVRWGVVALCLDLGYQNFLFSGPIFIGLTTYDQACATATDQNCCLRPPRIRCTIKLTQTSLPVLLTNESCWCIYIPSAVKCISFLISKAPSSKNLIVWVKLISTLTQHLIIFWSLEVWSLLACA